jgi:hypothetical protein
MKMQRRRAFSPAFLLCFILSGGSTPIAAQELVIPEVTYPALAKKAASAAGFVPQGWVLEGQASGDLNRDGIADLALVLRQNEPKNVVEHSGLGERPLNTNPRILAVAFREGPAGDYILQAENHTLIPRREDPVQVDPFGDDNGGIAIERGGLNITLHLFMTAGGWDMFTATHKFQHRNNRFELSGYDRSSVHRASGKTNDISVNYLTGKMKLATGHIASDKPTKVTWKTLPRRSPPSLDELGDGLSFDPQR